MMPKLPAQKILKHYISDIDNALAEFKHTHPLSASQQAEINKYQRIYQKRDHAILEEKKKGDDIWV
ncbi:MAG: hypothetical protein A3F41_06990 [Coxiella sp. RIFCSPHIGHO2_12_FULL_44_14]|nr:MAG: hypothetical protein A3F41_06990 [Coxiella sp. RIFCSPHIGHO2_12_FULL_44_14]